MNVISVTQHTAPTVLGVSSRRFREMIARHRIRHVRDGKIVIVLVRDWIDAMERMATTAPTVDAAPAEPVASVADMLASLGRRVAS